MSRLKKAFRTNTGSIPTTSTSTSGTDNNNTSSTGTPGGTGGTANGSGATVPQTPAAVSSALGMNEFALPAGVEKEIELEVPESHKAIADKTFFGLENVSLGMMRYDTSGRVGGA